MVPGSVFVSLYIDAVIHCQTDPAEVEVSPEFRA